MKTSILSLFALTIGAALAIPVQAGGHGGGGGIGFSGGGGGGGGGGGHSSSPAHSGGSSFRAHRDPISAGDASWTGRLNMDTLRTLELPRVASN